MLTELARMLVRWRSAFPRHSTWVRAVSVLLGLIVATARRYTITASIVARGRQFAPWAADYLVFSRAPWEVSPLFDGVVDATLDTLDKFCQRGRYLAVAVDDTGLPKTGKSIAAARWMRDPMGPPFQVNLRWGLRYLHLAILLPLHQHGLDPRAISIDFAPAPSVKKPGKKATADEVSTYKEAQKQQNLSRIAVQRFAHLRAHLDAQGHRDLLVLMIGDGSYTNRNVLNGLPERVEYLGRTRGDLALFAPAPVGGRKVYGERLPTPDAVRKDEQLPWSEAELFYAGSMRRVRFKETNPVLWPSGGRRRPLRLLVIAPTPYRARCHGRRRTYYRDPAYLLTTDLTTPAVEFFQEYLARWQIEVEHRDLKSGLGVGHAQVSNDKSVSRLHAAHVAMWSMVKLAALRSFGLTRTEAYPTRPAWYPQEPDDRASQSDIVNALRAELGIDQPPERALRITPPHAKRLPQGRKFINMAPDQAAA
jgi:hypothetical protein